MPFRPSICTLSPKKKYLKFFNFLPNRENGRRTGLEGARGPRGAHHAGKAVLPGHDGAVGDEAAELGDDPAEEGEVRTPADVGADCYQNFAL